MSRSASSDLSGNSSHHHSNHHHQQQVPLWMSVGESVQLRPSYSSGMIAFIGPTEFAPGVWVGVVLDAPTGRLGRKDYPVAVRRSRLLRTFLIIFICSHCRFWECHSNSFVLASKSNLEYQKKIAEQLLLMYGCHYNN